MADLPAQKLTGRRTSPAVPLDDKTLSIGFSLTDDVASSVISYSVEVEESFDDGKTWQPSAVYTFDGPIIPKPGTSPVRSAQIGNTDGSPLKQAAGHVFRVNIVPRRGQPTISAVVEASTTKVI